MEKEDWGINILVVVLIIAVDQFSKMLAMSLTDNIIAGPFHLLLAFNHGFIGGLFSDLPASLRIITTTTLGSFLIAIYFAIQYLLPIQSMTFRLGLSILLGGFLGNVTDKLFHTAVIDFISIKLFDFNSPIFNVADVFQWIGCVFLATAFLKNEKILWPENNARKKIWINQKFQIKYLAIQSTMVVSFAAIIWSFVYSFLKVTLTEYSRQDSKFIEQFLNTFSIGYSLVVTVFVILTLVVSRHLSHKIAGPVYAFKRFLTDTLNGTNTKPLKLRPGDEFKELEETSLEIIKKMAPSTENQ